MFGSSLSDGRYRSGYCLLYARVSRADQVEYGESLEYQISELKKYATNRDLKVRGIYVDKGISGRKEDRKEYVEMKRKAERGDIIIAYSISRISRSTKDFLEYLYA